MHADELFARLPLGTRVWMSVHGSSMRPLLRGDEELQVRRCEASELSAGDIAILARADGALVAHLVVGIRPVVTSSFSGAVDSEAMSVAGRADRLRRGAIELPLGRIARRATLVLHRAWVATRRLSVARSGYDLVTELARSQVTASFRKSWLGEIRVELASPTDTRDVAIFSSRFSTVPPAELAEAAGARRLAVARGSRRLVAMAFVDRRGVLARGYVAWAARKLGLENELVQKLVEAGISFVGCEAAGDFRRAVERAVTPSPSMPASGARIMDIPAVHPDAMLERLGTQWIAATPDERMHQFTEPDGLVSPVAERVAELIDGHRTVRGIVDVLCEEFEVDRQTCEADTLRFIDSLVERKVLTLTAPASGPTPRTPPPPPAD